MASVQDTNITETLLTAIMLLNGFDIAEIEVLWLSRIVIWGALFTCESFIFFVMAGWIAKVLFISLNVYKAV